MQALILAGGKGTRLGALTKGLPKPLVPIGGRPFIQYILDNLGRYGFRKILLLVGPFIQAYEEIVGDGSEFGLRVSLIPEDPPADTGGAIAHAALQLQPQFLLLNGDSFFDINYLDLLSKRTDSPWLAHVALREVEGAGRYGAVTLDGDRITSFGEKSFRGPGIINGGIYWLKREIIEMIGKSPTSLERDVFPRLAARSLLRGSVYNRRFIDIGTPEDLARARRLLPVWRKRPAAFLDRDGVLNQDTSYVHSKEQFIWINGAKRAVKRLNDAGYFVFVITNQAGIARGLYGPEQVENLHRWINDELRADGAHIDAFYYCQHHPTEGKGEYLQICNCRKPEPGLLLRAMREWPVRRVGSFMIGDKDIDLEVARRVQIFGVRLGQGSLDDLVCDLLDRRRAQSA